MSTKTAAFKRAVKAAVGAMGPQQYGAKGKPFACHFCGHDRFELQVGLISKYSLACAECGHVEFFMKKPHWIKAGNQ
jgi:hypothetical protein